jgi:transcriptional regulator with XRE-family HTH domain
MQFALKLKELRESSNMTQAELADVLGLKRATVTQYESGRISPSKNVLIKIANYFQVSVDDLIGQKESHGDENQFTKMPISEELRKSNNYTLSLRTAISQRIIAELYKKTQDQFIEDNKVLFLKLIDTLLELNMKAEESNHEYVNVSFSIENYDINKIISEFSKELHSLENLSKLFN